MKHPLLKASKPDLSFLSFLSKSKLLQWDCKRKSNYTHDKSNKAVYPCSCGLNLKDRCGFIKFNPQMTRDKKVTVLKFPR